MTTNQMLLEISKVLRGNKPAPLDAQTAAQIKKICDAVRGAK